MTAPTLANELDRRQQLTVMRRRATALLGAMTVVFVLSSVGDGGSTLVGYVRACAEAAMVGGLADWFAVTALFRHPLGVPIPHTAIIPTRKDQIGRSLGEFLQANFLSAELVADRLAAARPGARLAEWLARPGSPAIVARHAADALAAGADALRDEDVQAAIEEVVVTRLRAVPLAPIAGRLLASATDGARHQEILDGALRGVDRFLVEQKEDLRSRFGRESPWWVPESIDDRIFEKLHGALRGFIVEVVGDPGHELRGQIEVRLRTFIERLQHDPELMERGERLKEELLGNAAIRQWSTSIWADAKATLAEQAADPTSPLRQRLESAIAALGERLAEDHALQAKVDRGLARLAAYVLEEYDDAIGEVISSTVERWDPGVVTGQLELLLGRDLQFIRINGTVVGGLIGILLHGIADLLS